MEGYRELEKPESERKTGRKWRKNDAEVRISQLVNKEFQPERRNEPKELPELKPVQLRRHVNAEANRLHGGIKPEVIGQVLVTAAESKSRAANSFEARAEQALSGRTHAPVAAEQSPTLTIDTYVETISREDMLELAGKIETEGSNLRQMYETHLIGEKALRRLIAEHLKGGNLQEAVRKEMVEHEIDFERDPQMRDKDHLHPESQQHFAAPTVPQRQYELEIDDEPKPKAVRVKRRAAPRKTKAREPKKKSGALDALMYTVIVVLLFLVIYLALKK
jgi:hypothetical protein